MRILVVDDDAEIRTFVRRIAEKEGFQVEEVADGKQALRSIRNQQPDLIISDIFMPEMDGLELIRELRRKFPTVPIIGMSGGGHWTFMNFLPVVRRLGAVDVLAKPFKRPDLLAAIAKAMGPTPLPTVA